MPHVIELIDDKNKNLFFLASLGGFIGRKSDGEPGWQTIWAGYTRFQDMLWGATYATYG